MTEISLPSAKTPEDARIENAVSEFNSRVFGGRYFSPSQKEAMRAALSVAGWEKLEAERDAAMVDLRFARASREVALARVAQLEAEVKRLRAMTLANAPFHLPEETAS